MAGLGSRFTESGYQLAKPLLPIHGQPMFLVVVANLLSNAVGSITVVAQQSWRLGAFVERANAMIPQTLSLVEIDYVTGGPADTIKLTRPLLDPELPVITANSDQYVDHDLGEFYRQLSDATFAGTILTMKDNDPKWSYASTDSEGDVLMVREKEVISPDATVGIYGFHTARLMWQAFDEMRLAEDVVNGEYFVAPAYNKLIDQGLRVTTYDLGQIASAMHGLGIPVDYETFCKSGTSVRAAELARQLFGSDHSLP